MPFFRGEGVAGPSSGQQARPEGSRLSCLSPRMGCMPAWELIPRTEHASLWSDSTRQFELPPAEDDRDWPSWKALSPSITYKLQGWASMEPHPANRWAVGVMGACQPKGKPIVVVDWDHEFWWLDVHDSQALADREGGVWLLTLGDYSVFLSRELKSGMFCSASDFTLTVFGEAFVEQARRNPPPFVEGVLREDGRSPTT